MGLLRGLLGVGSSNGVAGHRVEGRRRQTAARLPATARDDADLDVECDRITSSWGSRDLERAGLSERRLVQDGVHSMMMFEGDAGNADMEDSKLLDDECLDFYQTKVLELQNKAGNENNAPIAGNLYSYLALRQFGDSSKLFQGQATPLLLMGLYFIVIIQVIGPVCILFYVSYRTEGIHHIGTDKWRYTYGSDTHGISHIGARIMAVLFIVLFMLNGTYILDSEKKDTRKIVEICNIFKRAAEKSAYSPPQEAWLWVGVCVNVWCLLMCGICMWPLFVMSEGPKDILFDALGLTFLYNMDDISGDFGFIDEKWDEDQFGDIYGELAQHGKLMETFQKYRSEHFTPDNIYSIGRGLAYLQLFILPLAFAFVELQVSDDGTAGDRRLTGDFAELQASNDLLRAQLAALNATVASLLPK